MVNQVLVEAWGRLLLRDLPLGVPQSPRQVHSTQTALRMLAADLDPESLEQVFHHVESILVLENNPERLEAYSAATGRKVLASPQTRTSPGLFTQFRIDRVYSVLSGNLAEAVRQESRNQLWPTPQFGPRLGPDYVLAPASHYSIDEYRFAVDPTTWLPRKSKINFSSSKAKLPGARSLEAALRDAAGSFEYLIDSFFTAISAPYSPEICDEAGSLALKWMDKEWVYRKGRPITMGNRCLELTEISGSLDKISIKQHVLVFAEDYAPRNFAAITPGNPAAKNSSAKSEVEKFFRRNYRVVLPEYRELATLLLSITNIDTALANIIYRQILTTGLPIGDIPDKFKNQVWERSWSLDKKLKSIRKHLGGLTVKEIEFYVDLLGTSTLGVKKTRSAAKKLARASRNYSTTPEERPDLAAEIKKAKRRGAPRVAHLSGIDDPYVFYKYRTR